MASFALFCCERRNFPFRYFVAAWCWY